VSLTSSELFILLGKGRLTRLPDFCLLTLLLDGSDLSQLSRQYNAHISVKPNPLAVYLEGSRESVRELEAYIDGVKKVGQVLHSYFCDILIRQ
jgi:hypothetical protein